MKLLAFAICFWATAVLAQEIPVGAWRLHPTYHNARTIALGEGKVFCASSSGMFYYDIQQKSIHTLSRLDGLSDNGVAKLLYHTPQQQLCILYQNGNLDFLKNGEITNVRTLLNSARANKQIADAQWQGQTLWLATGFGGMALDLQNFTVKEYFENLGGNTVQGNAIAILGDSVFLATNAGLFASSTRNGINRQDWQLWRRIATPFGEVKQLSAGTSLHALSAQGRVYEYRNGKLEEAPAFKGSFFQALSSVGEEVAALGNTRIQLQSGRTIEGERIRQPMQTAQEGNTVWIADAQAGLLEIQGEEVRSRFPSGPFAPNAFRLYAAGHKMLALSGGYNRSTLVPQNSLNGFSIFEEGSWRNYTAATQFIGASSIPNAPDLNCAAFSSAEQRIYIGSYGKGILAFDIAENTASLMENSPLYTTGLVLDAQGMLWACAIDGGLYVFESNSWIKKTTVSRPTGLLCDAAGNIWIQQASGNMVVYNNGRQRTFVHDRAGGGLRGTFPLSMAQSREESIWVGTDDGISEFFDPFSVFSSTGMSTIYGANGLPLNQSESITALAFDGGGFVWVGTANGGAWRYSIAGEVMEQFTQNNSPLPSNEIIDIAIQPQSGEVFFATSKGIASYRGTATAAGNSTNVAIFPNPAPMNHPHGLTVSGLVQDAAVRITDMAGRLVWQGTAQGGTANWNMTDYSGRSLKPGIYLVFTASSDGNSTFVGKVAVTE